MPDPIPTDEAISEWRATWRDPSTCRAAGVVGRGPCEGEVRAHMCARHATVCCEEIVHGPDGMEAQCTGLKAPRDKRGRCRRHIRSGIRKLSTYRLNEERSAEVCAERDAHELAREVHEAELHRVLDEIARAEDDEVTLEAYSRWSEAVSDAANALAMARDSDGAQGVEQLTKRLIELCTTPPINLVDRERLAGRARDAAVVLDNSALRGWKVAEDARFRREQREARVVTDTTFLAIMEVVGGVAVRLLNEYDVTGRAANQYLRVVRADHDLRRIVSGLTIDVEPVITEQGDD